MNFTCDWGLALKTPPLVLGADGHEYRVNVIEVAETDTEVASEVGADGTLRLVRAQK